MRKLPSYRKEQTSKKKLKRNLSKKFQLNSPFPNYRKTTERQETYAEHSKHLLNSNRLSGMNRKTVNKYENRKTTDDDCKPSFLSIRAKSLEKLLPKPCSSRRKHDNSKFCDITLLSDEKNRHQRTVQLKVSTSTALLKALLHEKKDAVAFTFEPGSLALDIFLTMKNCDMSFLNGQEVCLRAIYPQKQKKVGINSFQIIKCIGTGGFSRVFLCKFKEDGMFYAMKIINKHFINKYKKKKIILSERNVMSDLDHPFIAKLKYCFESADKLIFVVEYCPGGELFSLIKNVRKMTQAMARFYMIEILLALKCIHEKGIIYRDFKPENILLDQDGHLKITDFGLAKPKIKTIKDKSYSFCGSPEYMPPEMVLKQGHSFPMDFYCLGAVLFELITGLPPFYSKNHDQIYQSTVNQTLTIPKNVKMSAQLKSLLFGLLQKDQKYRIGSLNGVKEVLSHPWFGSFNQAAYVSRTMAPPVTFNRLKDLKFNCDEITPYEDTEYVLDALEQQMACNQSFLPEYKEFYYDYRTKLRESLRCHRKSDKENSQFSGSSHSQAVFSIKKESMLTKRESNILQMQFKPYRLRTQM